MTPRAQPEWTVASATLLVLCVIELAFLVGLQLKARNWLATYDGEMPRGTALALHPLASLAAVFLLGGGIATAVARREDRVIMLSLVLVVGAALCGAVWLAFTLPFPPPFAGPIK